MKNKCPRCGSIKSHSINIERINSVDCEFDVICSFCNYAYDFYSYGNWESDCPLKPCFCWNNIKLSIYFIIGCIYYRIKRKIKWIN